MSDADTRARLRRPRRARPGGTAAAVAPPDRHSVGGCRRGELAPFPYRRAGIVVILLYAVSLSMRSLSSSRLQIVTPSEVAAEVSVLARAPRTHVCAPPVICLWIERGDVLYSGGETR